MQRSKKTFSKCFATRASSKNHSMQRAGHLLKHLHRCQWKISKSHRGMIESWQSKTAQNSTHFSLEQEGTATTSSNFSPLSDPWQQLRHCCAPELFCVP